MSVLKNLPEGRRERNKADKLAKIEAAARELFEEEGYEETTTRAIAERAGIATGTLFTYFPEKRLLLLHLVRGDIDRALERAFATLPVVPPASPVDALAHLFGAIYRVYERDRRLARVFVKEVLFVDEDAELASWTLAFIARLSAVLDGWRKSGALGPHCEPTTAAFQIFAQYHFVLVAWLGTSAVTRGVRDTMFRTSLAQLVRGIAPEPGESTQRGRRLR